VEPERFEELAILAESIAEENFEAGKTDLLGILQKNNITLIKGNYETYFLGNLVHLGKRFYLYLNMDMLTDNQYPRIRFTIAHELGHYFIDEHRNLLKKGTSLSFNHQHNNLSIEKEANHFASFLLMPTQRFLAVAASLPQGLSAILYLAGAFESSIDCTSIQYIKLNCCTGLLIRWNENNTVKTSFCSDYLAKVLNSNNRPLLKNQELYFERLKTEFSNIEGPYEIIERATPLSRWIATLTPGAPEDLMCLEQTIKLGKYGGLTLVMYNN
jgi:hypothetical protein